ncbi:MAG: restriction endonuclease, partial [Bacteroidota bacterium]|nr:restriction endonuclease [Bacteroidota bacterium]
MPFIQISGATPSIYRSIPSQETLLLLSPRQETIFTYLSKIPYQRFPEFIRDILALVDGHKIIDLTDGPGDEKQDILTINPEGKRCLIQCKHTKDHRIKYSGDNLDLLFSASVRKNCDVVIFVTNGDLSTQAKRYINDSEYRKKTIPQNGAILIDYWNGYRIWEKLQTNPTILNKWFGNLGQVHGLRNFSFEITLSRLPYHLAAPSDIHGQLLTKLLALGK